MNNKILINKDLKKLLAQYKCKDCHYLFYVPFEKAIHDGVVLRHYKICPLCKSININKLNIQDENKNKRKDIPDRTNTQI